MIQFLIYFLGYFLIFKSIDMGRVESERYSLFTQIGFIQFLMIMAATMLISMADRI